MSIRRDVVGGEGEVAEYWHRAGSSQGLVVPGTFFPQQGYQVRESTKRLALAGCLDLPYLASLFRALPLFPLCDTKLLLRICPLRDGMERSLGSGIRTGLAIVLTTVVFSSAAKHRRLVEHFDMEWWCVRLSKTFFPKISKSYSRIRKKPPC